MRTTFCAALAALVAGCGPSYSPNTYSSNAVQQANKVDQGVLVGVRAVDVSAAGTAGAVVGGAAGGIAGAQAGGGVTSALGAVGGALVGGIAGSAAEHVTGDTHAFEYIVRKANGDLLSVTQKDEFPLLVGQKVLVISGNQARVVLDYTAPAEPPKQVDATQKPPSATAGPTTTGPTTTGPTTTAPTTAGPSTTGPSTAAPPTTVPAPGPVAAVPLAPPPAADHPKVEGGP